MNQGVKNQTPPQPQQPNYSYEGLVNPVPINVELRGRLPAYDFTNNEVSQVKVPTVEEMSKERKPLFASNQELTIFRKHIPKQAEIDRFLEMLKEKVIHDYNIPISVKELRAEYKNSPFFKDIVTYISRGYCRYVGKAQRMFKMQCEDYVVVNGVLFKLRYDREDRGRPSMVLCVPEKYIPTILYQHHTPVLAGHPGVLKLYETIKKKYYFPGMFNVIRQYVVSCLECQSMKNKEGTPSMHYPRIPVDMRLMAKISLDIKEMPESIFGYNNILVCVCEETNWVKAIPMADQKAQTIADAIYFKIICEYGTPKSVICDEAPAFTSELMKTYFHSLNIKPFYISPMNHGSNRSERYIRTMNEIICKNLTGEGDNWPLFVPSSCWAMNSQVSPLTGYSPFEIVYQKEPPDLVGFNFKPDESGLKVDTKEYLRLMRQRREMMTKVIVEKKKFDAESRLAREMRKYPDHHGLAVGDLVLLNHRTGSVLQSRSKKLTRNWIGPLRIQAILDDTHYLVSDWSGQLLPKRFHINRLKPYSLNLGQMTPEGNLELIDNIRELYRKWKYILEDDNVALRTKEIQANMK